jgi:hypothetical protein
VKRVFKIDLSFIKEIECVTNHGDPLPLTIWIHEAPSSVLEGGSESVGVLKGV